MLVGHKMLNGCKDDNLGYKGKRYVLKGDMATMLLFDQNGKVAGIQMAVPQKINIATGHKDAFLKEGENYLLTAYFTQPSSICDGTSKVKDGYIGDKLFLVMNEGPVEIPLKEQDIGSTQWTKGKCFQAMGQHYWFNTSVNMDCKDFAPFFLMYDGGELNGFGFATFGYVESVRTEHPPPWFSTVIMSEAPTCILNKSDLTTLHVFLKSKPYLVTC